MGFCGVALLGAVVFAEMMSDRLATGEFVAVVIVGAVLALGGPITIASAATASGRTLGEIEVATEDRKKEETKTRRAQIELLAGEEIKWAGPAEKVRHSVR